MQSVTEQNKSIVRRFNREVVEQRNMNTFHELVSTQVVNHAAPAGTPNGPESMIHFIKDVFHKAFSEVKVEIFDQVAEDDRVVTRKAFHVLHSGELMGIPATQRRLVMQVIDTIRLRDGKYVEHWGMSNLSELVAQLKANK